MDLFDITFVCFIIWTAILMTRLTIDMISHNKKQSTISENFKKELEFYKEFESNTMTFEEIYNITKVNKDKEFMPVNNVDMILQEIKDRAIGDCYTNGENLIHRLKDIAYICDLFLVKDKR